MFLPHPPCPADPLPRLPHPHLHQHSLHARSRGGVFGRPVLLLLVLPAALLPRAHLLLSAAVARCTVAEGEGGERAGSESHDMTNIFSLAVLFLLLASAALLVVSSLSCLSLLSSATLNQPVLYTLHISLPHSSHLFPSSPPIRERLFLCSRLHASAHCAWRLDSYCSSPFSPCSPSNPLFPSFPLPSLLLPSLPLSSPLFPSLPILSSHHFPFLLFPSALFSSLVSPPHSHPLNPLLASHLSTPSPSLSLSPLPPSSILIRSPSC